MRTKATSPTFVEPDSSSDHDAEAGNPARRHEVVGIVCVASTALLALALASFDVRGGENWVGPVGAWFAGLLTSAFGLCAWIVPFELVVGAYTAFSLHRRGHAATHAASMLTLLFLGCAFLHLVLSEATVFGGQLAGGVLGELIAEVLRSLVGAAGAYVVCVSALLITLVLRTRLSVVAMSRAIAHAVMHGYRAADEYLTALLDAWQQAKEIEREERERLRKEAEPRIVDDASSKKKTTAAGTTQSPIARVPSDARDLDTEDDDYAAADDFDEGEIAAVVAPPPTKKIKAPIAAKPRPETSGPVIVAPRVQLEPSDGPHKLAPQAAQPIPAVGSGKPFVLPPTRLLSEESSGALQIDEATLKNNAIRLVEKLEAYGVKGRVDEIHPGPVVTMYEFEPQSGTKISKIASLSDDLAMALAAQKVRIVAPIPGKARVGFELPNDIRQTVFLRELLEDERWHSHQCALPIALGKDIAGQPVYGDLAKMPHLLVAGATGSGKSVGLNVMLTSLLMKKAPEDVRLLMIDPKVVELAVFDGIPHMLLPVVTDMKKASLALRWAVDEMERRYQLFADAGSRNIASYNQRVERVLRGEISVATFAPKRAGKVSAIDVDGHEVFLNPDDGERADAETWTPQKLPSIVLVVDEFADLMMVAAKDVECAIARLAQKARAAGIHVILATQRPSVDVITGMIKANFPSRIGFKVSQREDSKTILGRNGAEHLLGMGDMLTLMPGSNDLRRVHSAFISEDEVKEVCDFLRAQGEPVYDDNILKPRDEEDGDAGGGAGGGGAASDDPYFDRAVAVVAQAGYCSISHIQRHLSVGYNKAAKLVERMEKEGVVGPASSKAGGRREVFIEAR